MNIAFLITENKGKILNKTRKMRTLKIIKKAEKIIPTPASSTQ